MTEDGNIKITLILCFTVLDFLLDAIKHTVETRCFLVLSVAQLVHGNHLAAAVYCLLPTSFVPKRQVSWLIQTTVGLQTRLHRL